jgi:Flp pilus assembly protein TadD
MTNVMTFQIFNISGVECASKTDIDQHLSLGMQLLAHGQYSDALSHFHSAVGKSL